MSGVMIKMGIYGLLRTLTFLGLPPMHWGVILLVVGGVSGVMGVLYALAQHDLKRLLAYHSVEHIGIMPWASGSAFWGPPRGFPSWRGWDMRERSSTCSTTLSSKGFYFWERVRS
jgi:hydrogenase-4 component B